jgi:FkbM family methyltransferase
MATNIKRVKSMTSILNHEEYSFEIRENAEDPSFDHNLDFKVVNETWIENVYRIHDYQFVDGGIFVDIGANIGAVSLFVDNFNKSREDDNKIKVYAVEPEPNNLLLLNHNINNNDTENITVVNNAIWYEKKMVSISNRGGNSSIVDLEKRDKSEVLAITMENLFSTYKIKEVDVMKIDIEGAEFDLILNTPAKTLAKIKILVLEFDKSFDGKFGQMVEKLSKQFGIDILGSPERGGYIYANRY